MTKQNELQSKRVLLLGFGEEGRASLEYAVACGASEIAVADQASTVLLSTTEAHLVSRVFSGADWLAGLRDYDVIIRSPGVPLRYLSEIRKTAPQIRITSGTDIFLERHRDKTIAVTGTKGKSTTSSLIHHMLVTAGIDSQLGGNIGIPALKLIDTPAQFYVLELSSYQLADATHSPNTAVILNLYPEHLDHHGSFASYGEAKANIARFQRLGDRLILPDESAPLRNITSGMAAEVVFWGPPTSRAWVENNTFFYRCRKGAIHRVCATDEPLLKGPGNQRNILAALATVSHLEISSSALHQAIATFRPLPHRLETVAVVNEVTYVNDSISTVPEATMNALETFGEQVQTVILGGYDRGVSFEGLANHILQSPIKKILLFAPSGERIARALREHPKFPDKNLDLIDVTSMSEAVSYAALHTAASSVCLLSPASPSFPLFKNFQERGNAFRNEVIKIQQKALMSDGDRGS